MDTNITSIKQMKKWRQADSIQGLTAGKTGFEPGSLVQKASKHTRDVSKALGPKLLSPGKVSRDVGLTHKPSKDTKTKCHYF